MAYNPFLRGMTGQQMGVGRPSLAQMMAPATAPTPTVAGPTMAAAQPLDIAGLRRQVLAQAVAPTAPQSRQALMAKYGLAPTAPAPKPSAMQRVSAALPATGTPEMAGLGAAGRTMMELSGWQKATEAPSLGQILARSAEAGIGVMQKKQEAEQARAQAEAATEAAARKEAREERELQIKESKEQREAATGPKLTPTSGKRIVEKDGQFFEEQYAQLPIGTPGTDNLGRIYSGVFNPVDKPKDKAAAKDEGYIIRDGKFVGKAVRGDDGVVKLQTLKGELLDISPEEGDILMSEQEYKSQQLSPEKMSELATELDNQLVTRKKLEKFMAGAETASEGVGLLADQFTAATKTFLKPFIGKYGDLTKEELAARIQEGELNALVGGLRLETVGGGVMTEQDALRVISRLGGNINAWRSKDAVREAVSSVLAEKNARIEQMGQQYNREVDFSYSKKGYKRFDAASDELQELFTKGQKKSSTVIEPTDEAATATSGAPEGVDPSVWAVMTPEEKALWP
jgi:hypothetical protein